MGSVAAIALFTACGQSSKTAVVDEPAAPIVSQTDAANTVIPAGQLPEGVTPTAYTIDLRADPTADTFSGIAQIDVTLDEPTDTIFLHSLDADVSSVMVSWLERLGPEGDQRRNMPKARLTAIWLQAGCPA